MFISCLRYTVLFKVSFITIIKQPFYESYMCGIVGVFNHEQAFERIITALAILKNRGKDGFGITDGRSIQCQRSLELFKKINTKNILGHSLHAVVNTVPQPIGKQGVLVANCEIYNWEELNKKYNFTAQNDADLLLSLLDSFGIHKLDEIDGVYAFAYWNSDILTIARDILGEKPLWFAHSTDNFAFASEKKALERTEFIDIQELNPRQVLTYDIKHNTLKTTQRPFFEYLPEHEGSYEELKEKTKNLLHKSIQQRIPTQKFGLLFSGGIDSTYLAAYFKNNGYEFTCYTAVLDSKTIPPDLEYSQKAAAELNLNVKVKKIKVEEIPPYLEKIVPLIEDSNVVKVGVALPFYIACGMAREDGCKVIFSGLGSEEIFAGYERHKNSSNINQECVAGLRKMYERDFYRDDVLTMDNNLELRLPFLDLSLVKYALKIPERYKFKEPHVKFILRDIALDNGLPEEFAFRKKTAAQYGSRFDSALGKLAKKNGFSSKSAYLRTFYPAHNLKLGVLFSSGKDSTYAAYIMKRQNYELACLISMRSSNPDSYMFQTASTEMIELQAEAMGLPIVIGVTEGEKEKELRDLEMTIKEAKEKYKLEGIVSGAVFSTYQRDRIETICDKLGLKIFAPLWHKPQIELLWELLQHGFEVVFSRVAAEGVDKSWLGAFLDEAKIKKLEKLNMEIGFHEAGEGGEFESLVLDCPLFQKKIRLEKVKIIEEDKHTATLIIEKARLEEK